MPPNPWEPTRTPIEQVAWPDIAPTKANRTAAIWNNALPKGDPWYGMHLWLTKVSTGWNLSGSTGQSRNNRIFYPRNLSQQPIVIEGQMPNQYQYDRLVYFIKRSHETALDQAGPYTPKVGGVTSPFQLPLTFALPDALLNLPHAKDLRKTYRADAYWDGKQAVRRYYRAIYVDGYITGIRAGHPRWNFAPRFQMSLLVSYDHIDEKVELANQMTKLLQSQGATYSKTNDQITQNYRKLLRITKGSVNDLSRGSEAEVAVSGTSELDDAAYNMGLGDSAGLSTWTVAR